MSGTIVVVCNSGEALNNRRGTIVGWSEERSEWTVAVYDGPMIQLGKRQLHTIDEGWHTDMKSRLFNKVGIMRHFQGPGSHKPPRHAEFRQRSVVPTTKMIEDFWGKRIWSYMEERLKVRMAKQGTKTRKLVNAFWGRNLNLCRAVVFSDGTKQSQASPYRGDGWDCWWPVLATNALALGDTAPADCGQWYGGPAVCLEPV